MKKIFLVALLYAVLPTSLLPKIAPTTPYTFTHIIIETEVNDKLRGRIVSVKHSGELIAPFTRPTKEEFLWLVSTLIASFKLEVKNKVNARRNHYHFAPASEVNFVDSHMTPLHHNAEPQIITITCNFDIVDDGSYENDNGSEPEDDFENDAP